MSWPFRILLSLLVLLGWTSSAIHLLDLRPRGLAWNAFEVTLHGAALFAGVLAVVLAWKARAGRDTEALAWLLAFLCSLIGIVLVDTSRGPEWYTALRDHALLITIATPLLAGLPGFMTAAFARFATEFPRPLSAADLQRVQAAPHSAGSLGMFERVGEAVRSAWTPSPRKRPSRFFTPDDVTLAQSLQLFRSRRVWLLGVIPMLLVVLLRPLPDGIWSDLSTAIMAVSYFAVLMMISGLSLTFLQFNFRLADDAERRSTLWLVEGLVAAVAILAVATIINMVAGWMRITAVEEWVLVSVPVALLVFLVCVAIAVFFYGAIDPRLMIRRTAIYGMLTGLGVFAFAGIETIVSDMLAARLGLPPSIGSWIAGATIALAWAPIHGLLRRKFRPYKHGAMKDARGASLSLQ